MKTVIFTLYQKKEFSRMRVFIQHIKSQLTENRQLYILVNDEYDYNLQSFCDKESRHIHIFCESKNLGVAGGRNFLIKNAINNGFDFFISSDNDIIYEKNYYSKMEKAYLKLKNKSDKVGVIQPILLDGRKLKEIFLSNKINQWQNIQINKLSFDYESLIDRYTQDGKLDKTFINILYHVGISNIWEAHFSATPSNKLFKSDIFKTEKASLLHDKEAVLQVLRDKVPIRIASTAGGISAFDFEFIQRNGLYDNKFNPFLYEDSEFGFRAFLNNEENYLVTDCCAIHDFFLKDDNRTPIQYASIAKLRAIESRNKKLLKEHEQLIIKKTVMDGIFGIFNNFRKLSDINTIYQNSNYLDKIIFRYYLNYLFGRIEHKYESFNRDFFVFIDRYLQKYVQLNQENVNVSIMLSDVMSLVVGTLTITRKKEDILGISALNVRIESKELDECYNSRYFDFYCIFTRSSDTIYSVEVNIQSNEKSIIFKSKLDLEYLFSDSIEGSTFYDVEIQSKDYDYGTFSVEEIYPNSTLSSSKIPLVEGIQKIYRNYETFFTSLVLGKFDVALKKVRNKSSRKRILIFTDSRGQHIPSGSTHKMYADKLKEHFTEFEFDIVLCPMKWTTSLDFFDYIKNINTSQYYLIILHTGIVEWSPRPQSNAMYDLYDNKDEKNLENWHSNSNNYSKKIVNNKKDIFDSLFGEEKILEYLNTPFEVSFEGEKTINMYSLKMAHIVGQKLQQIKNLIYINANKIVPDWEGDFKRGRPKNISIIEKYNDIVSSYIPKNRLIDLRRWSLDDVKNYTCDNMHLSSAGNEYIFNQLKKIIFSFYASNNETFVETSFTKVNKMFLEKRYLEAFNGYSQLVKDNPNCYIYQSSLFICYYKLKEHNIDIKKEKIEYLKKLL